jgi:hypothetical protein
MFGRWIEFFEDDSKRLSMTRLLCFLSFFPASYVLLKSPTEGMLGWYLGAYVLGYVGGKGADVLIKGRNHDRVPD